MNKTNQQLSKDRYLTEKVDTFVIRVPKGKKAVIQAYAKKMGQSTNAYITHLIDNDMQEHPIEYWREIYPNLREYAARSKDQLTREEAKTISEGLAKFDQSLSEQPYKE